MVVQIRSEPCEQRDGVVLEGARHVALLEGERDEAHYILIARDRGQCGGELAGRISGEGDRGRGADGALGLGELLQKHSREGFVRAVHEID